MLARHFKQLAFRLRNYVCAAQVGSTKLHKQGLRVPFKSNKHAGTIAKPTLKAYNYLKKNQPIKKDPKQERYECEGCTIYLQSDDPQKYGYINSDSLKKLLRQHKAEIQQTYKYRIDRNDEKFLTYVLQIEKQMGTKIYNRKTNTLEGLDDVGVLMKLQEKVDSYQNQEQTLSRSKPRRKEILCSRCYNLKYHNKLLEEYNVGWKTQSEYKESILFQKLVDKHAKKNTIFLYLIDCLDILGTFKPSIFEKLLNDPKLQSKKVGIVVTKYDVLNEKYLMKSLVRSQINSIARSYKTIEPTIFFVSNRSKQGINKLKKYIDDASCRVQLVGLPNTGKTTLLNSLARSNKTQSKIPGTTLRITAQSMGNSHIFDMPGIHYSNLMYNLIQRPSDRALLTWNKIYSPGLLTHSAFIYGGKVEIEGTRIIVFGHGGACSSDNRWFMANYREFWKGLPALNLLKIRRYEQLLQFQNGKGPDLEIAGYGFIAFRDCLRSKKKVTKLLTFYLPEAVQFRFRNSVLSDTSVFHNKSAFKNKFMLQRLFKSK